MTTDQQTFDRPETIDWVARAKALAPTIEAAAGRIEAERRVPDDIMGAMHEAKLFRMCLPKWLDGGEAPPLTVMQTTEAISAAEASAAWCLGQALGCSRSAAMVDRAVAEEIFSPPDAVLAWGPPGGKVQAIAIDGGYRVSGTWRLASGVMNATWLGPLCPVVEPDGSPRLNRDGKPLLRVMLLPALSADITDVWQVLGLRGTGSNSFTIDDLFVPEAFSYGRDSAEDRREPGPLYAMLQTTFYGIAFGGVALGIARTALDDFIELTAHKTPANTPGVMRDSPAVQRQVALVEANLGAARAYLLERIRDVWECGAPPPCWSLDQRARLRLACTNAVMQSRDAVAYVYQAAGSTAIFEDNPFERRFRDINTVANQAQGQPANLEQAARALLGVDQPGSRI